MSVILNAGLALDDRERQVADLAEHRADCTEHDRRPERHFKVKRPVHNHSRDQHEDSTADHAADCALYRLFRADDRRQLMLAEQHAREQSAGVRAPGSEQRQQHDERTVVVVHLENAQQAEQQVRHGKSAEKRPRDLRSLHDVVIFQLDRKRTEQQHQHQSLHHALEPQRQDAEMTDSQSQRDGHCEQQFQVVAHQFCRAEHLIGGEHAQRRHDKLQHDRREHIQRQQHKGKAEHAKQYSCFHTFITLIGYYTPPKRRFLLLKLSIAASRSVVLKSGHSTSVK